MRKTACAERRERRLTIAGPVRVRSRFQGCLLGGAVGDALGAPVEFMKRDAILRRFSAEGITAYAPAYGGLGTITDDTQMTLFTAEGLLRGWVREATRGVVNYPGVVGRAYQRWLQTQGDCSRAIPPDDEPGWLIQHRELHDRRAPGNTCLSALRAMESVSQPARNDSKGCGGVMRVAPVGLFAWTLRDTEPMEQTFRLGSEVAALTHGHPTGFLTAGVLAVLVRSVVDGASLPEALATARECLRGAPAHEETLRALEAAEQLASTDVAPHLAIARLGTGWIAEEALAIGVYCALVARDFRHGVVLAVNHDGDSDSTGSITGNLLGALSGVEAIPGEWLAPLELRGVITEMADDLLAFPSWAIDQYTINESMMRKYPGF